MLFRPAQQRSEQPGIVQRSAVLQDRHRDGQAGGGQSGSKRRVLVPGEVGGEGGAEFVLDVADQPAQQMGEGEALPVAEPIGLRKGEIGDRRRHARVRRREQLRRAVQLTPVRAHFGHGRCIGRSGLKPR